MLACAARRPQREKFDRRIEPFELVLAHRARPAWVKQASKAAGDQQLLASARARCFYPANEVDVGTDQREIEPHSRSNVAVADRAVMQGYPGAQLGIRPREPVQPVESLLCGTESAAQLAEGVGPWKNASTASPMNLRISPPAPVIAGTTQSK